MQEYFDLFADFVLGLYEEEGQLLAYGTSIPIRWNGAPEDLPASWDEAYIQGIDQHQEGKTPNSLSLLAAVVDPDQTGRGLSRVLIQSMKNLAVDRGLSRLIAPVRPTLKARYPLTPMERYIEWKRDDGLPLDPWIRVHARMGARALKIAPASMTVSGSISDWELWTDLRFPESGPYVVPDALQPIRIDVESDLGTYEDPNVWMEHPLEVVGD